jgi:hypothetical protein
MIRNLRIAVGYNVFGFHENYITTASRTDRGLYLHLGYKFSEDLFRK